MISLLKQKAQKLSEERIIKKIQKGENNEFGRLYLNYVDSIFRYIFFRVNQDQQTAEDITEITFQKAFQNMNTYKAEKGNFRAWLFRIAHNSVIDFYRQAGREVKLSNGLASPQNLEAELGTRLESEKIQTALKSLTDEQRNVVTMRFVEDMTHGEIAQVLSKKENAVRAIQYRALRALRETLS